MDSEPAPEQWTKSPGMWVVRRPRLHLALGIAGLIASAAFLVLGLVALTRSDGAETPLVLYTGFWGACVLATISSIRRAVRALHDPEGVAARIQEQHRQVMAQPRETLLRKAAITFAVVSLSLVVLGVLAVVLADDVIGQVLGFVLLALGAGLGVFGVWRHRHPVI